MDFTRRVFQVNPQVIVKRVENEDCLIDPYRRVMVRLNTVAREIFAFVDGKRSVREIIELMKQNFDAEGDVIGRDVLHILKEFVNKEIII